MLNWIQNVLKSLSGLRQAAPAVPASEQTGAVRDNRPVEQQASDVHFADVVSTPAPVNWQPLDLTKLPSWPVLDQGSSLSCVAFTKALMATMLYYVRTGVLVTFSPKWIYNFRKNKAFGGGMIGVDAFDIEETQGLIPEDLMPSQGLSEAQINDFTAQPWLLEIGKALRMSDQRIILPTGDIDTVASVSQVTGKPIMVWFRFSRSEWGTFPTLRADIVPDLDHSVTLPAKKLPTDQVFGLYQGKKAVVIQDSWGLKATNLNGLRVVSEDFFKLRNFFAAYSMRFKFDDSQTGPRPSYDGKTVVSLQQCLRYEGDFPMNVAFIESYGPVTKKSVSQFQQDHGLAPTGVLDDATKALVKQLYP